MVTRAIARKLSIKTIDNAPYVAGNDIEHPNHLLINGEKVIRVNTLGRIKEKYENPEANYSSLTIEDEGSELKVKFFDYVNLADFNEGEWVKVIGKIRQQNEQKYIIGEIIKKEPEEYKRVRQKELFTTQTEFKSQESQNQKKEMTEDSTELVIEDLGEVEE